MSKAYIDLVRNGLHIETRGLNEIDHPELRITLRDATEIDEGEAYLKFVCKYLTQSEATIRSGETIAYGYWLTKFLASDDGVLEAFEYNAEATSFVRGIALTLTYWRDQHAICDAVRAKFDPPRPDRRAAISVGVYDGEPVEGVRYPSPEHMSGWWLTTDRYDGNAASLNVSHLYHVTAVRPDLARYMALPVGYRFRISRSGMADIWFDDKVAKEPAGH